jgi:hypothetical protein
VCPNPLYSLELSLCDFWLFSKVKMIMKGKRFESIQDIEAATMAQLKTLAQEDFQKFRKWQNSGISVFEVRGCNGSVSFTVILFLLKHSPYFFDQSGMHNEAGAHCRKRCISH